MFAGFTLFGRFISSYSICVLVGAFIACPLAVWRCKKRGGDDISMIFVFLFGFIGAFIGMQLLYGITNIKYWEELLKAKDFIDWCKRFGIIFGGGVFYGGLIGGLIAGGISIRVQRLKPALYCDCAAFAIPLFHGFGRIGCFLSGCCYGKESEYGITFTDSIVESANGVPRIPVQLYEAAFEFALFAVIFVIFCKDALKGKLLALYLLTYSVGRFMLEFLRGDDYRGFLFGLSTSQLISIALFFGAAFWFIFAPKKRADEASANAEERKNNG